MRFRTIALLLALLLPLSVRAEPDPASAELATLRDGLVAAINRGDIDAELAFLNPNVVVTFQNAEVSRGTASVRSWLQKMLTGPEKVVEKFRVEVSVDESGILYGGQTAIAYGSAKEHFEVATGRAFDLSARWSATMVKADGQWSIASLHASENPFDNPFLKQFQTLMKWVGCGSLIFGAFVGFVLGRRGRAA